MKTVVGYASGIPNPHKNQHKVDILKRYIDGVQKHGDKGILHYGNNIIDSDVNLIQGWVHAGSAASPHLVLRRRAHEININKGKHSFIADSNLFNYAVGKMHNMQYLRYSMDGVFPTTGNYFTNTVDPNRWNQIQKDLNISMKDWRPQGVHVLICTQRNGGWSMGGLSVVDWLTKTIKEVRKHTDRPIIVRGHPGDKHAPKYLKNKDWQVSKAPSIIDDLRNAHCSITYNSSPSVASAIEGIPTFITDPTPQISQAYAVANTDLSNVENPLMFERTEWVQKLAMSHWNFNELSSGDAWAHMRDYV
ncbi:MAG: hypothetical protein ACKVJK_03740 [Methylophagaceae bacterium]|jgi:hypothetical protein|tara:strand:- start:2634 stop:3548 length:915 start_codon:yes stop_codon:yes gene_type:complete